MAKRRKKSKLPKLPNGFGRITDVTEKHYTHIDITKFLAEEICKI